MVQQNVSLDTLSPSKLGPRKQLQAQRNGGRVEGPQLVLETELLLARPQAFFVAEPFEGGVKQIFVQLRGPVFVGIPEGGFIGGPCRCRDEPACPSNSPGRCKSR